MMVTRGGAAVPGLGYPVYPSMAGEQLAQRSPAKILSGDLMNQIAQQWVFHAMPVGHFA